MNQIKFFSLIFLSLFIFSACGAAEEVEVVEEDNLQNYEGQFAGLVDCGELVADQQLKCQAYFEQDASYCESLSGEAGAWCVTEIVRLTGDEWSCLDIGPQYGQGWQKISNTCLGYAAYILQEQAKSFDHVCELMISPVPGEETLDWSAKDNCFAGKLTW